MTMQDVDFKQQGLVETEPQQAVPVEAPVAPTPVPPSPRRPKRGLVIGAIAAVVALLAALIVVLVVQDDDGTQAPTAPVAKFGDITSFVPAESGWSLTDAVVAPDGSILAAARGAGNRIAKLSPSGQLTMLTVPGTDLGSIVVASDGTIWTSTVTDNASSIVRLAPDGTNVQLFRIPSVDLGPAGVRTVFPIHAMALAPDGKLWFQRGQINRWDSFGGYSSAIGRLSPTGKFDIYPMGNSDRLYAPGGMAFGPDGRVWFSETCVCARSTSLVVIPKDPVLDPATGKLAFDGKYTAKTSASGATGVGPHASRLIVVGNDLWFVEQQDDFATEMTPAADITGNGAVARIPMDKPSNEAIVEYALPTRHSRPTGITLGGDGNLWITESGTGKLARMSTSGVLLGEYAVEGAPDDIVTGPDGNVYYTTGGAVDWTINSHTDGLTGNQFPSFNPYPNKIQKFLTK